MLQLNKPNTNLTFSPYYKSQSDGATATEVWNQHKTIINKDYPTLIGYEEHITMGIGYTSDNFYIVRSTNTHDGKPYNTYYYNNSSRKYTVLGLNFSNSSPSTAWGTEVIRPGSTSHNVKGLKHLLNVLYYPVGSLYTNEYDNTTLDSVKQFQSDYGLTVDGIVGSGTYKKLKTAHLFKCDNDIGTWRVLSSGKKGDDVAQLQLRLYKLNYLPSSTVINGNFGSATKAAVIAFQNQVGLTADGAVGKNTFSKLYGSILYLKSGTTSETKYAACSTCYKDKK